MLVLVVGGTRCIGPHVVRELVSLGHDVTVYHRGEHEPVLPTDVRHIHSPEAALPVESFPRETLEPAPDVVIHMTPMGERDSKAAVATFRNRAGRFVALSSGDVYAIVMAALHPAAAGIYNVGEEVTPTMAERLAHLPPSSVPVASTHFNFEHDIAYDTVSGVSWATRNRSNTQRD